MIKVSIKKENDLVKQIKITGPANQDEYGKDIVCASCSSIVITTVNAILSINKDAIDYQDKKDFEMNVLKDDEIVDCLQLKYHIYENRNYIHEINVAKIP